VTDSTTPEEAIAELGKNITSLPLDAPAEAESDPKASLIVYQRPTLGGERSLAVIDLEDSGRMVGIFKGQDAQIIADPATIRTLIEGLELVLDIATQVPATVFEQLTETGEGAPA
jgi:hypothetical protein